jgi:rhamnulose-1-phosphate aldolase/alcohol dehydrogenase
MCRMFLKAESLGRRTGRFVKPMEPSHLLSNPWRSEHAPEDLVDQLVYASNLLGSDPRITNFGGGNTSSKVRMPDPLTGEVVDVLWVKVSGGDLRSSKRANFASLYLDKLLALERRYRDEGLHEDEIVPLYAHCIYGLNPAPPSIDTPLHAVVPARCVSHMHADAVIALAAAEDAERLTQEIFGGEMGFLPWKRPGFELGLMLRELIAVSPTINSALLQSHGFICWADTWEECTSLTVALINRAAQYISERQRGSGHPFGAALEGRSARGEVHAIELLPKLRGRVAHGGKRLIAHLDQSPEVLEFLAHEKMERLARMGTSCPDHFLRTKIRPLVLHEVDDDSLDQALASFRSDYAAYYERCKRPDSPPLRNPNPSVVLVPGLGMISFGKNVQEARVTGSFYRNATEVMRGAEALSAYTALPEQEAFDIEYWQLEEAKLRRMPPEKELSRQVALVTGAAQGIGRATALKLASLGAHVVMIDVDEERVQQAASEVEAAGQQVGGALAVTCDVTDADALSAAFRKAVLAFGGIDIVVVNAGNARRGTVAETSGEDYKFLSDLLMKAYFDTIAEATRLLVRQGTGGSIVIVASKNGVAAGSNAALYSAAKAFELHLMRTVAVDFAKYGIRCNAINPDAVVQGSGIWSDAWREQTAKSLGIEPQEIDEHYRKRSLLGVSVTPEDCAEAICWLASEQRSSRTTGGVIPVDGGNREGFLR